MDAKNQQIPEVNHQPATPLYGPGSSPRRLGLGDTCEPPTQTAALTKLPAVLVDGVEYPTYRNERGEEVMQDLDIGRALELSRPRNIRKVIAAHTDELGEVRSRQERSSDLGGPTVDVYYLTEEQALFIAAKCRTKAATAQLKRLIAVYMAARKGNGAAAVELAGGSLPAPANSIAPNARQMLTAMLAQQDEIDAVKVGLVSMVNKTEELDAKVTKLLDRPAPRAKVAPGAQHVAAVQVASALKITPRSFSLFLRARNQMRTIQRSDGRWPLDATVQMYRELMADSGAQLAIPEPLPFCMDRQALTKQIRRWCVLQGNAQASDFKDVTNLCYERFAVEEGYDPRDFASSTMSALDIVQKNGHISRLFNIVRRLCPLSETMPQEREYHA